MEVNVAIADGQGTLRLQGRFDFNSHREFRDAADKLMHDAGVTKIVVDLAKVDYLDSSALGMLLMLRDRCRSSGKVVSLSQSQGAVKQILDIANFGKLFTIV
jgi:anti-anti-sigma factor